MKQIQAFEIQQTDARAQDRLWSTALFFVDKRFRLAKEGFIY